MVNFETENSHKNDAYEEMNEEFCYISKDGKRKCRPTKFFGFFPE